jgi:hypothetical protein
MASSWPCGEVLAGAGPTAFEWAHASWDNARYNLLGAGQTGRRGGDCCHALATRSSARQEPEPQSDLIRNGPSWCPRLLRLFIGFPAV